MAYKSWLEILDYKSRNWFVEENDVSQLYEELQSEHLSLGFGVGYLQIFLLFVLSSFGMCK